MSCQKNVLNAWVLNPILSSFVSVFDWRGREDTASHLPVKTIFLFSAFFFIHGDLEPIKTGSETSDCLRLLALQDPIL
jgi:hypothetical protein